MVDLAQRLHVIGDKGDGNNTDFSHPLCRELTDGAVQRRLQPPAGADLALVAQAVAKRPCATPHHEFDRLFNLALIRIALFDD